VSTNFLVQGSAVPEPSAYVLMGIAAAGLRLGYFLQDLSWFTAFLSNPLSTHSHCDSTAIRSETAIRSKIGLNWASPVASVWCVMVAATAQYVNKSLRQS